MVWRKPLLLFTWLFVVLTFFIFGFSAAAQTDLPNNYTFDSSATFNYPDGWRLSDGNERLQLTSDDTRVYVLDDAALRAIKVPATADEADTLQIYFEEYHSERAFKPAKVETLDISRRSAVQYDYSADDGRALIMAFRFDNGTLGLVEAMSLAGKLKETDLVLALVESFESMGEAGTTTTTTSTATEPVDCTVSTNVDETVRVRVGPGENRASIIFLSADEDFQVLGQATANDGSLWWKLDKEVVAPNKSANEVWVAQNDVKADGNCEAVLDVNAPPVIPISNVPPPSNSGNTGGGDTGNQPGAGSVIPQSGLWTVVFSSGIQSCAAFPNDTLSYDPGVLPFVASISVTGGGSGFLYDDGGGNVPFRLISPNTYQGVISFQRDDGRTASLAITVTAASGRQMSGVGNIQDNYADMPCSGSFPITMNRQ